MHEARDELGVEEAEVIQVDEMKEEVTRQVLSQDVLTMHLKEHGACPRDLGVSDETREGDKQKKYQ